LDKTVVWVKNQSCEIKGRKMLELPGTQPANQAGCRDNCAYNFIQLRSALGARSAGMPLVLFMLPDRSVLPLLLVFLFMVLVLSMVFGAVFVVVPVLLLSVVFGAALFTRPVLLLSIVLAPPSFIPLVDLITGDASPGLAVPGLLVRCCASRFGSVALEVDGTGAVVDCADAMPITPAVAKIAAVDTISLLAFIFIFLWVS
jgi:hypothetical protein